MLTHNGTILTDTVIGPTNILVGLYLEPQTTYRPISNNLYLL